jgi:uncharacterized protein (DUF427 family)
MGLSWQQGPLGRDPNGQFLVGGMPERVLYAEPLRRRLRAELGGRTVVQSDDAVLLFEPGRYPVAYFPRADFAEGVLRPIEHRSRHPDLGETAWFAVIGDERSAPRGEEDDRILGHAGDPYHRIDIRHSSRHLVARAGDRVLADTTSPLVLYESGFAPRWYVPRADVVAGALTAAESRTFCPYKGIASYYDLGETRNVAWSYRAPFEDMAAIGEMVSFEPDRVEITLDGERLEPAPGQTVVSHGIDRDLSIDEAGALRVAA